MAGKTQNELGNKNRETNFRQVAEQRQRRIFSCFPPSPPGDQLDSKELDSFERAIVLVLIRS